VQLHGRAAEVRQAGAELVFVGNGSPEQARAFQQRRVPGDRVFTDPELSVYRGLGMRRGVGATLGLRSLIAGAQAYRAGFRQEGTQGDPWQQGGLLALARGGRVVYEQRNRSAGDRPDLEAALAALREAMA
jgi:hypothetical protein